MLFENIVAYLREKGKLNLILKFEPTLTCSFWDIAAESFFVFSFCQYNDEVNEENWQIMLMNFFFANVLLIFY